MPDPGRRLRDIRAPEAIRAFQRLGYQLARSRGSHHVLRHPEKGQIILPVHRGSIKVGIIMDALKKAGISVAEFERHL